MQKLFYSILFVAYSIVGFSQSDSIITIQGLVWNEDTKEPENGAIVEIYDTKTNHLGFVSETDSIGCFNFQVPNYDCYSLLAQKANRMGITMDTCLHLTNKNKIILQLEIYSFSHKVYDSYIPYPDSLKSDLKVIIQDDNSQLLDDFFYWIYPINYNTLYQPKTYFEFGHQPFMIMIFQNFEYQVHIHKIGYEPHQEILKIDNMKSIKEYTIKLKKTN